MCPAKDNTIGVVEKEIKVRALVYLLEKTISRMDESQGIDKLTIVIDFGYFSQLSGIANMKVSKDVAQILQDHYPGIVFW